MKRKTKVVVGFLVIILAAIAIVSALFLLKREEKTQIEAVPTPGANPSDTSSPKPAVTIVDSTKTEDWHIYNNTDYGFRVTFSDIWKGYQTKIVSAPKEKVDAEIEFTLSTTDPIYSSKGGKATPLIIYVYKSSNWNEESQAQFPQTKIAECQGFVFTYSTWEEAPQDFQGLTEKEIADTLKDFQTSCKN